MERNDISSWWAIALVQFSIQTTHNFALIYDHPSRAIIQSWRAFCQKRKKKYWFGNIFCVLCLVNYYLWSCRHEMFPPATSNAPELIEWVLFSYLWARRPAFKAWAKSQCSHFQGFSVSWVYIICLAKYVKYWKVKV